MVTATVFWACEQVRRRVLTILLCALAPVCLLAQSAESDVGEIGGSGGGSFGAGTHPYVGGSTGLALSKSWLALLDVGYTPMGNDIIWRRHDVQSPQGSYLLDAGLNFHVRFPVTERLAPYALFGAGLLFNSFTAISGPQGTLIGIHDFKGSFQTGAGLRYYINESWGLRPEVKVIVSSRTFTRVSVGVFYTLPSNWP
jgi:hypothetical protein